MGKVFFSACLALCWLIFPVVGHTQGVEVGRRQIQREWQRDHDRSFYVFRDGQATLYQSGEGRAMNMNTGAWGVTGPFGDVWQFGGERDEVLNDLLMQEQDGRQAQNR